jgi:acyl carrier protein
MIPQYFIDVEKMPLTPTGKIDRMALPAPKTDTAQTGEYEAPVNEIEKQIILIWQEILGKENIGIHSNFFDLGGHSLLIITLISRLGQLFQVKLQLKDVFDNPTVKALSRLVSGSRQGMFSAIEPTEKKEYYALSSAQKRLLVLQQSKPDSIAYHIPGVYVWEGDLNVERFEAAFQRMVERHETLRTSFCLVQGVSVQCIQQTVDFKITFAKCSESQAQEKIKTFRRPFDLGQPPLLRVELLQIEEKKYFISFNIHHIISDAYSMQVLIREFAYLYEGKSPEPLAIQYKDFAAWQNRFLNLPDYKTQEKYWLNTLENFQFTRLPVDKFHSGNPEKGGQESHFMDKIMTEKIGHLARKYGITRFALIISVFFIVLAREISQKDITIGIPSTHREHHQLRDIIGIFINVLLIREKVDIDDSFLNHMLKMKQTIIAAMSNQDYPYEFLYAKIKENTNFKENELFTILFNYFPTEESIDILTGLFRITKYTREETTAKYDATVYVMDMTHTVGLNLVYRENLFSAARMKRLMDHFIMALEKVLADENIKIIDIFRESTRTQGTDDFAAEYDTYYEDDEMLPAEKI